EWVPQHAAAWVGSLRDHVLPIIGDLPVQVIDDTLALRVLHPIWTTKRVTADRVRNRCEAVIGWATTAKLRTGDNPFRWENHLKNLLAKRPSARDVKHLAALDYREIPGFVTQLRSHQGIVARALEATVLLTARTGEILGAKWTEFDLRERIWTLPA